MKRIILRALIFIALLVPVAATGQSAAFKLGKNLDIQFSVSLKEKVNPLKIGIE